MTTQQPEALRLAELLELAPEDGVEPQTTEDAAAELRRLHAAQVILDCMTHIQNPAPQPSPEALRAAPRASYSPEDRAFHQFWYSHMSEDLMQPPLIGIPHSTARYIWDAALRTAHVSAQAAPVCGSPADLPPLPDPDLRDVGTTPGGIKEFLRGYATEYAKAALAARKQGETNEH